MVHINKRVILRVILPIFVFLLASFVVFWFIKSSEIKKNIKAAIELNSGSSIGKISTSGFPFFHKIEFDKVSLQISSNPAFGSVFNIDKIIAKSGVFSNNFKVTIAGDPTLVNSASKEFVTIKFNKEPVINFSVQDYKINKLSYADSGYKVINNKGEVVFYTGSTDIAVSIASNGILHDASIKANFSNISSFDIFSNLLLVEPETSQSGANLLAPASAPQVAKAIVPEIKSETNKNIKFDIKFSSRVSQNTLRPQIINVNNFELSSPLFKINLTGSAGLSEEDKTTDLTLKVEDLDNILIYVRSFVAALINPNEVNSNMVTPNEEIVANVNPKTAPTKEPAGIVNTANAALPTLPTAPENIDPNAVSPAPDLSENGYDQVVANFIINLAKSNPNSNDKVAEFKFQGNNSDFRVNDTRVADITLSLSPVFEYFKNSLGIKEEAVLLPDGQPKADPDLGTFGSEAVNVDGAAVAPPELPQIVIPNYDQKAGEVKNEIKNEGKKDVPSVPSAPVVPAAPAPVKPVDTLPPLPVIQTPKVQ